METTHPEVGGVEALHVARSRFIDAHAKVEEAICRRLRNHDIDPANWQIAQRIEALKGVKASPRYSKQERNRVHDTLARFTPINEIRCDIAHGQLKAVKIDGEATACFVNARNAGQRCTLARLVRPADFATLTVDLEDIAKNLA